MGDDYDKDKQVLVRFIRPGVINRRYTIASNDSHTHYDIKDEGSQYEGYMIQQCDCIINTGIGGNKGDVSNYLAAIKQGPPDKSFVGFVRFIKDNVDVSPFETLMGNRRHVFISKTFTAESDLNHNPTRYEYIGGDLKEVGNEDNIKIMNLRGYEKVKEIKPNKGKLTIYSGCDTSIPKYKDYDTKTNPSYITHGIEDFKMSDNSSLAVAPLGTCMVGVSGNLNEVNFKGTGTIEGYLLSFTYPVIDMTSTLNKIISDLCINRDKCDKDEIFILEPVIEERLKERISRGVNKISRGLALGVNKDSRGLARGVNKDSRVAHEDKKDEKDVQLKTKMDFIKEYKEKYGDKVVRPSIVNLLKVYLVDKIRDIYDKYKDKDDKYKDKTFRIQQEIQKLVDDCRQKYGSGVVKDIHSALLLISGGVSDDHYLNKVIF